MHALDGSLHQGERVGGPLAARAQPAARSCRAAALQLGEGHRRGGPVGAQDPQVGIGAGGLACIAQSCLSEARGMARTARACSTWPPQQRSSGQWYPASAVTEPKGNLSVRLGEHILWPSGITVMLSQHEGKQESWPGEVPKLACPGAAQIVGWGHQWTEFPAGSSSKELSSPQMPNFEIEGMETETGRVPYPP